MTQWIRTLAVLKEDPAAAGSYTYLCGTPISGGSDASFGSTCTIYMFTCDTQTQYTYIQVYIQEK